MNRFESKPEPARSLWRILAGVALVAVIVWGAMAALRHPAANKPGAAPAAAQGQQSAPPQPPPPPADPPPPSHGGAVILDM